MAPNTRTATACHAPDGWHETMVQFRKLARVKKLRRGANGCDPPVPQNFVAKPMKFHELGVGAAAELASMRQPF